MLIAVGELLIDIFPDRHRIGGAPFNFAFHLKKMGLRVRFISRVGDDALGRELLGHLQAHGFSAGDIQIDREHPTGTVRVSLDARGVPTFTILQGVAYDFLVCPDGLLHDGVRLVYFGTLIQRTARGQACLKALRTDRPAKTRFLYDVNLRPGCYTPQLVRSSLSMSDIVKMNAAELEELMRLFPQRYDREGFVRHLMEVYGLEMVSITCGDQGSELYTPEGGFRTPGSIKTPVIDTVGAGDAYAAILAAGYLARWHPREILERASHFASRICSIPGATPENEDLYTELQGLLKGLP